MRLGLWAPLPHTIPPEPEISRALEELATPGAGLAVDRSFAFAAETVQRAEALGFEITLVAERLVARDLEAWVAASALAALTQRIGIMVAAHPGVIAPQVVAKMGASLDRLSGGRFAVNVIPGRRVHEFALFGNDGWLEEPAERYRRMEEFMAVMTGLWGAGRMTHEGRFYAVRDGEIATKPVRRPPVYAASGADLGKDVIAKYCDVWFVSNESGLAAYRANLRDIEADIVDMRRRARALGRELGFGLSAHVVCAPTAEEAEARAARIEALPDANVPIKALGAGLVGTPAIVAERIRRWEAMGIGLLMLQFHPMREGLEGFARDVMPLLRP